MSKYIAEVIIDHKSIHTDKLYTYLIKTSMEDEINAGMRVIVPFGLGNRMTKGIVIIVKSYNGDISKLKYIEDLLDDKPIISSEMIKLCLWMREKYLSSYGEAISVALPPGDFKKLKTFIYIKDNMYINSYSDLSFLETKVIDVLKNTGNISYEELKEKTNDTRIWKAIKELESKGLIELRLDVETKITKKYQKFVQLSDDEVDIEVLLSCIGKRGIKQREAIKYLYDVKQISMADLLRELKTSSSVINSLEKKGLVTIFEREVLRNPIPNSIERYKKHKLTVQQESCLKGIQDAIKSKVNDKFLIHGVTGSGKTEIYLQLIEYYLKCDKDVIVLVPEISLTPQTVERFVGRFGENVAVLHSKLSYGERFDEWRRIREGKVQIVVGARSAIFAPFNNLGLIIIDEEHESSYKSSMNPKYDAIEVAEKRCSIEGASLVMGTATPSISTYHRTQNGEVALFSLDERVNNKPLPSMDIVDMREELDRGNISIFSSMLHAAIEKNLKEKKQTILFLNRRGYSTFVSCRKCGYVVKCKNCDISMTYHFTENVLKCHYCGLTISPPTICPNCKSKYIKYFGIGTQKIEEEINKAFPTAKVARIDMDTMSKKNSHQKMFNKMKRGDIDILIGTQMITKGLDFPSVTLVGILAADTSLNIPDYKSSERTFQLITQVAGRAGRGNFDGRAIVQTYNPNHFSIKLAKDYDYREFYNKEIKLRSEFGYPPFKDIITLIMYGEEQKKVELYSKYMYNCILDRLKKEKISNRYEIFGPNPAPISKLRNNYRWQILIKSNRGDLDMLKNLIKWVCINNSQKKQYTGLKYSIDINPNSIL